MSDMNQEQTGEKVCMGCNYLETEDFQTAEISCCSLTHRVVDPIAPRACEYHNKDLTQEKICYTCKYYCGGGDWGLFCSHEAKYYHLGNFNDKPCNYYIGKDETV